MQIANSFFLPSSALRGMLECLGLHHDISNDDVNIHLFQEDLVPVHQQNFQDLEYQPAAEEPEPGAPKSARSNASGRVAIFLKGARCGIHHQLCVCVFAFGIGTLASCSFDDGGL